MAWLSSTIAQPADIQGRLLLFMDLDLDLVRNRGEEWKVINKDDFVNNSIRFGYPQALTAKARTELA